MEPNGLFSVTGKTIVITGGEGRLGKKFVQHFLDQGAKVVSLDLRQKETIVAKNFLFIEADVTNKNALKQSLEKTKMHFGIPSALIACVALDTRPDASAEDNGPFEVFSEESWDLVMEVNVKGPFLANQIYGSAMAENGGGSIVNIGSIYGVVSPDQNLYEYRRARGENFFKPVAYSASKSALYNFTRYVAQYWARKSVRCNIVTLGGVFDNQDAEFLAHYTSRVPMGRMADAEDYFGVLQFLISDASRYMTGADVRVDGGWTAI